MLNRPGTTDNWIDESSISQVDVQTSAIMPLFLAAFTSDRGPVGLKRVSGNDFYKLYGSYCDYSKHGQPLIQAANIIENGGELLCSRIVASDAKLANLTITATITSVQEQKKNSTGALLYIDNVTGLDTIEATTGGTANEIAYINTAKIKYDAVTVAGKTTYDDIKEEIDKLISEDVNTMTYTYPIFTIVDNGVGASTKRFKIASNYNLGKTMGFAIYQLIYDGVINLDYEYINFSTVQGKIYNGSSMSIDMTSKDLIQIEAHENETGMSGFYSAISSITGIESSELETYDLLFATTNRGKALPTINVDETGYDLSADIGFALQSGDNGLFGSVPKTTETYSSQILKFFDGTMTEDIYDLDQYQIDACVDAGYDISIKRQIVSLADFRKDFFFFGDLGLGANSYDQVATIMSTVSRSKFAGYYYQSYNIIDPFSKRYVPVTLMYSLAAVLVNHFNVKPEDPFCGILHNYIFRDVVEGTINWLPKVTPSIDQKTELQELGVNYASILNGALTLETELTSQEDYTQLSFINNVTAIQVVIKDIRYNCPRFRYSFSTTNDLDDYKENVSAIVKKHSYKFESLKFIYMQDDLMKANKIFEADLRVVHKAFYQAEIINVYTLSAESAS